MANLANLPQLANIWRAALRAVCAANLAEVCGFFRRKALLDSASESVGWQNFGKMLLVFGCIGFDFCKKICVLQHFSKSTRFSS